MRVPWGNDQLLGISGTLSGGSGDQLLNGRGGLCERVMAGWPEGACRLFLDVLMLQSCQHCLKYNIVEVCSSSA